MKENTTFHRWTFVLNYSSHHSICLSLTHGARTPHSPGPSLYGCWAGLHPRTCRTRRDSHKIINAGLSLATRSHHYLLFVLYMKRCVCDFLTVRSLVSRPPISRRPLLLYQTIQSRNICVFPTKPLMKFYVGSIVQLKVIEKWRCTNIRKMYLNIWLSCQSLSYTDQPQVYLLFHCYQLIK